MRWQRPMRRDAPTDCGTDEIERGLRRASLVLVDDRPVETRATRVMRSEPELLRRYDEVKVAAASRGADSYREAKAAFFQLLLAEPR